MQKPEVVNSSRKYRVRVLVCAPSNSALDEIVLRVLNTGKSSFSFFGFAFAYTCFPSFSPLCFDMCLMLFYYLSLLWCLCCAILLLALPSCTETKVWREMGAGILLVEKCQIVKVWVEALSQIWFWLAIMQKWVEILREVKKEKGKNRADHYSCSYCLIDWIYGRMRQAEGEWRGWNRNPFLFWWMWRRKRREWECFFIYLVLFMVFRKPFQ